MDILTAILSVVTLVAIAAVAALALKGRNGGRNNEALREYIKGLNDSNQRNIDNLRQAHSTEMRLLTERHEKQVEALSKQWEERITQLDSTTRLAFKSLTQDSAAFLKGENADQMNTVLAPLRQRLVELTALIQRVQTDATSSRESLRERIDLLAEQNRTIGDEAKSLATALRGNSKVQGDWGETILQTILEKAGLQEGVNFRAQPGSDASGSAFRDSNGRLQRPDFIIDLPNGHRIIVDSKVSLTDYVEYCDAKDDNDRNKYGKRHVDSVKKTYKGTWRQAIPEDSAGSNGACTDVHSQRRGVPVRLLPRPRALEIRGRPARGHSVAGTPAFDRAHHRAAVARGASRPQCGRNSTHCRTAPRQFCIFVGQNGQDWQGY